jgi:phosphohistidine swiveling domain-containing protein
MAGLFNWGKGLLLGFLLVIIYNNVINRLFKFFMSKNVWRKNFSISRSGFHMLAPAIDDLYEYQDVTIISKAIKEIFFIQEDYECKAAYFPVNQLRKLVNDTLDIIKKDPKKIDKIHKEAYEHCDKYFSFAKKVSKINFKKVSNKELADIYKNLHFHQKIHHGYAICTTWFVDSDGEDFSNYLLKTIKKLVDKNKYNISFAQVFSDMTTPEKLTMAIKEEVASLKILKEINNDKKIKKIFAEKSTEDILGLIKAKNKKIYTKIISHYKKWRWVPFTYIGPAYEIDFYLDVWKGLIKEDFDYNNRLEEIRIHGKKTKEIKLHHINKLSIGDKEGNLYKIASEVIHLKAYRKDCFFYGMYVLDMLLKEIALRLHLSLKQVRFMAYWEIPNALKKGSFNEETLNKRIKFSILYKKDSKNYIYTGEKAKKFLSNVKIEKEKKILTNKLSGTCACVGKAKGRVRIINLPEEMGKMNEGDIMVSHTTFPSLVPAMKKASAIVTDDGGITCHAAIVAREMKKPCIVGAKAATQVLKDGYLVEVDAEKGTVKTLSKK